MDFETGKPLEVVAKQHPSVNREYRVFYGVMLLSLLPYIATAVWFPLQVMYVVLSLAYLQVLFTLARSSGTASSHYIRFLLSGSNPIGMTGGSSLLFGAVDAIFDFREDAAERRQKPVLFWLQTLFKFFLTPIGIVLLVAEFVWDFLLMRHPRLMVMKWRELFSLAQYHDVICPEKSNDVFYADLAISRYQNDPHLYQWNRMRAMVFELKQYKDDATIGIGVPATNLFLQTDVAAYQTLKRLRIEDIESALDDHYASHIDEFPFPKTLAGQLIKSARPIAHYLKMKRELPNVPSHDLPSVIAQYAQEIDPWKVLRLLDSPPPYTHSVSRYINQGDLNRLASQGILRRNADASFELSRQFQEEFEEWLESNYVVQTDDSLDQVASAKIPDFLLYQGQLFRRREEVRR